MNPVFLVEALVVATLVIYGALRLDRKDPLAQAPAYLLAKIVDLHE